MSVKLLSFQVFGAGQFFDASSVTNNRKKTSRLAVEWWWRGRHGPAIFGLAIEPRILSIRRFVLRGIHQGVFEFARFWFVAFPSCHAG